MNEETNNGFMKRHWLTVVTIALLVLGIGLSFAGPFYQVKDGEGGKRMIFFAELIGNNLGGTAISVFFIALFLVLPCVAILLILAGRWSNNFVTGALLLLLCCAVASIVAKDSYSEVVGSDLAVKSIQFCGVLPIIVFFTSSALLLVDCSKRENFSVWDIAECGILIAAALVLDFFKIFSMPTGGSVNLQVLPLMILALRRGPLKGLISCGIVYGLVSCLIDGYGFATYPFDYLLGFGSVAVAGFFSPLIFGKGQTTYNVKGMVFLFLACVLSTSIRFLAGTVSSMIIYDYAIGPAALYNVGYVFASGGIATGILMALYGPMAMLNSRFPVDRGRKKVVEEPTKE